MWLINLTTITVIELGTCWEGHARAHSRLPPSRLLPPPDLRVLPRVGPGVGLCTPLSTCNSLATLLQNLATLATLYLLQVYHLILWVIN